MRNRYDENGNIIGAHRMVFDEIPDEYQIVPIILDGFLDYSFLGIAKHLRDIGIKEYNDNYYYSEEVLSNLALDYLNSAIYLKEAVINDRNEDEIIASCYFIPAAFLCKHSLELKIKECLLKQGLKTLTGHNVLHLWNKVQKDSIPRADQLTQFLYDVEKIDINEMALRYGVNKDCTPIKETQKFDIIGMIANSMFFFNIVDEYVITKR